MVEAEHVMLACTTFSEFGSRRNLSVPRMMRKPECNRYDYGGAVSSLRDGRLDKRQLTWPGSICLPLRNYKFCISEGAKVGLGGETNCDCIRKSVEGDFPVLVFKVTMFVEDALAAETDSRWLLAVHSSDL
jgi:hypothetical protein